MNIVVDDTDSSLSYSGPWTLFAGGSSRQWESTVHSTTQTGATVSFKFQGSAVKVYGTVPIGNGATVLMDVTIDGAVSPIVSRTTGSEANFANLFYQSSNMESTAWHTVIITNRGKAGNVDFQFDRVELDAPDIIPTVASFSPPPPPPPPPPVHTTTAPVSPPTKSPSNAPSSSPGMSLNPTSTIASTSSGASSSQPSVSTQPIIVPSTSPSVLTQIVTTTRDGASPISPFPDATQVTSGHSRAFPIGIIIGILGGIIGLLILILLLILLLRRRKIKKRQALLGANNKGNTGQDKYRDRTTEATPFTVKPSTSFADLDASYHSFSRLQPFSAMSEKILFQQAHANRSENDLDGASTRATANPTGTYSVTFPSSDGTGSVSNFDARTLSYLSESTPTLFPPAVPQGQPEPAQTDVKNEAGCLRYMSASGNAAGPQMPPYPGLRYLSGYSEAGPSMSAYGGIRESMYDVPPAYRPNK